MPKGIKAPHPSKRARAHRKRSREYYRKVIKNDPEKLARMKELGRISWLKRRYGLTLEDFDRIYAAQDGLCGICGEELGERPHIDHDHDQGRTKKSVRGLLCVTCNTKLGWFENKGWQDQARKYLKAGRFF